MASTKSSSLGRSNPNSRSSELTDPMRRSFTGNPFAKPSLIPNPRTFLPDTPANSPSEFPRRNSVGGREGAWSSDDKENAKDQILKPSKARSPAASSKSAKNFMSPTISASSKIIVSPRKKVLVERNEPGRASVPSTTDAKSPIIRKVTFAEPLQCSDLKPESGAEQKKFDALSFDGVPNEEMHVASSLSCEELSGEADNDMNVDFNPKNDNESSFETVADEPDCVILDPSFKLSPTAPPPPHPVSSTSTILAPLDADPLMPPYDPKTNYLSPRPQFLHYKPKPRIELCKERGFEDSFMSGSFSDTEVTEDTQSEEGSQKESEDVSSDEVVEEEAGKVSEPSPIRTFMAEETVGAKKVPKPRFFMRSKAIVALLLLLSVAFISISFTNSPMIDRTAFQDIYKMYELSEFLELAKANFDQFTELAKANFDGLAQNLHTWFTKSLSSVSELVSNVRGVHNLGHLQYYNSTVLHECNAVNPEHIFGSCEKTISETPQVYPLALNEEEIDAASEIDTDEDIGDISVEHYDAVYEEQVQQDMGVITVVENTARYETPQVYPLALNEEESDAASEIDTDEDIGDISVEHYDSVYEEQVQQDMGVITVVENASDDAPESEEVLEGQPATVIESNQALQLAEVSPPNPSAVDIDLKDQPSVGAEAGDIHSEVFKAGNLEAKQALEDNASGNVDEHSNVGLQDHPGFDSHVAEIHTEVNGDNDIELTEAEGESISIDAATEQSLEETIDLLPRLVLYLLLCGGAVLIAGATFNWSMKGKSRSTRVTSSVEQPLFAKAFHVNSLPTPKEELSYLDKPSLRNVPTEIDLHGETCPSEMSSIQKSSFYRQTVVKELNEVHSLEKKPKKRRESMASSSDYSMGSPSYGSFTTYEKIQIKNGHGDEETITPVRRSSRIRSQATSLL